MIIALSSILVKEFTFFVTVSLHRSRYFKGCEQALWTAHLPLQLAVKALLFLRRHKSIVPSIPIQSLVKPSKPALILLSTPEEHTLISVPLVVSRVILGRLVFIIFLVPKHAWANLALVKCTGEVLAKVVFGIFSVKSRGTY